MRVPGWLIVVLCAFSLSTGSAMDVDHSVRYVNDDIITLGDVRLRSAIRREEFTRKGVPLPSPEEFWRQSIEILTDEVLLTQKAKELGIQSDHDAIVLRVLDLAKNSGRGLSLRDQAEHRRFLEREETISRMVYWYNSLMPAPRPQDLLDYYQSGQIQVDIPNKERLLQIALRPAAQDDRAVLSSMKAALLKQAQDTPNATIKALVDKHFTNFFNAETAAGQEVVLDALMSDLIGSKVQSDLTPFDQALIARAATIRRRQSELLTPAQISAKLEVIRLQLAGLSGGALIKKFYDLGAGISTVPLVIPGSDGEGWVDTNVNSDAYNKVVAGLEVNQVSRVFWLNDAAYIVVCAGRKAARKRSFDEVSGEIERKLTNRRLELARARAITILRGKATLNPKNAADISFELE